MLHAGAFRSGRPHPSEAPEERKDSSTELAPGDGVRDVDGMANRARVPRSLPALCVESRDRLLVACDRGAPRDTSIGGGLPQVACRADPARSVVVAQTAGSPCGAGSRCAQLPRRTVARLPQHPDQHRPERSVLLAVDQELGEGAALRVAPELTDPVGSLEVREHEYVEQFGAGSGTECVQALAESALEFVGTHDSEDYRGRMVEPAA